MTKLLLVFLIFIVVFPPQKLPSFIRIMSGFFAKYALLKEKLIGFVNENFAQESILEENIKKAQDADKLYTEINKNTNY